MLTPELERKNMRLGLWLLAVFVVIFVVLAILASIPFALGWLVLAPVAVGASYAAWREVFSG